MDELRLAWWRLVPRLAVLALFVNVALVVAGAASLTR